MQTLLIGLQGFISQGYSKEDAYELLINQIMSEPNITDFFAYMQSTLEGRKILETSDQQWLDMGLNPPRLEVEKRKQARD